MPTDAATIDHCQTADDVWRAARAVYERRRAQEARLREARLEREALAAKQQELEPPPVPEPPARQEVAKPIDIAAFVLANEDKVREALDELSEARMPPKPTRREIQKQVASAYEVRVLDMISQRRTANIVQPRQVSMMLCRHLTTMSFPEIGRRHGDRDHTTALHAWQKLHWLVEKLDAELTDKDPMQQWAERALHHYPKKPKGRSRVI
jgi:hypothetical protein